MSKTLASIQSVTAGYDTEVVLKDVSLNILTNDFIGIIGPNGGGKTTLIKLLLGIMQPLKGKVIFPAGKIKTGYLPQASQIDKNFPISVEEVVGGGIDAANNWFPHLNKKQKNQIRNLLDEAGISQLSKRPIGELSGGQLQRVLFCRALINNPVLLILDEPNTYVDMNFEHEIYEKLKILNDKMAIVLVSHDVGTISSVVKTIACVNVSLHYHPSNELTENLLKVYKCPIDLVAHGTIPHRVLGKHEN
jgi:zinc transport system ATP-binding protein